VTVILNDLSWRSGTRCERESSLPGLGQALAHRDGDPNNPDETTQMIIERAAAAGDQEAQALGTLVR
jgi:hypothetical protein